MILQKFETEKNTYEKLWNLISKKILGKISVDAWDWANDLKSYDTTVKNVS